MQMADIWHSLSFYGDLVFTIVRALFLLMLTHLITRYRESMLVAKEKAKKRGQAARPAEDLEDEAFGSDDSEDSGISMCAQRRRRIARLNAGVQWQHHGRRRVRARRY